MQTMTFLRLTVEYVVVLISAVHTVQCVCVCICEFSYAFRVFNIFMSVLELQKHKFANAHVF